MPFYPADDADSEVLRLMTEVAEASRQRVALEAQLAAVQRSDGAARAQLDQARVRAVAPLPCCGANTSRKCICMQLRLVTMPTLLPCTLSAWGEAPRGVQLVRRASTLVPLLLELCGHTYHMVIVPALV